MVLNHAIIIEEIVREKRNCIQRWILDILRSGESRLRSIRASRLSHMNDIYGVQPSDAQYNRDGDEGYLMYGEDLSANEDYNDGLQEACPDGSPYQFDAGSKCCCASKRLVSTWS
jgi:hypothetical protein